MKIAKISTAAYLRAIGHRRTSTNVSVDIINSMADAYPNCAVDISAIPWNARYPGDGLCAPELNIEECGYGTYTL